MGHHAVMRPPLDLEPVTDLWTVSTSIGDLLGYWGTAEGVPVRVLVPGNHQAYARILHPARSYEGGEARAVRWHEIAERTGVPLEGEIAFRRITVPHGTPVPLGPQGAWDEDSTPLRGSLPREETLALLDILRPLTSTVCWFLLWEGWRGLRVREDQVSVPWSGNPYLVFRGPLGVVASFDWSGRWQSPHLWFPDDRAWCVATDDEGDSTHVAGPSELIQKVSSSPSFESLPTEPDALAVVRGEWLIP